MQKNVAKIQITMQKKFKFAICGAGPVGQALALLMLKRGIKKSDIVLIDAKTRQESLADKRTIAISYGSANILQQAGAWPVRATEIHQIHVSRRGHFGRTLIDRQQHAVPTLGYVARYPDIITPLLDAMDRHGPELSLLRPAKVSNITQTNDYASIVLEDQSTVQASIVVQAEGGLFSDQAALPMHHDYQQSAVIAKVSVSSPVAARAYERFTDQGPLALLPQEDGYSLVWCVRPEQAQHLLSLDDAAFLSQLQTMFGNRLGKFTHATPRAVFALGLNAQTSAPDGRVVCIGNAAQTLHPVAGQGLNLGLRDALLLSRFLSISDTTDSAQNSIQDFYQSRIQDRNQTIQITDRMAQMFTQTDATVPITQTLLGAGLGLVDIFMPAKHWLASQMMFGRR